MSCVTNCFIIFSFFLIKLQFLPKLRLTYLWRQILLPVLQYPGSLHLKKKDMELSKDLSCITGREALKEPQPS